MNCCRSSSSSGGASILAIGLALGLASGAIAVPEPVAAAQEGEQREGPVARRIALFPLENRTGEPAPVRLVQDLLERSLALRGVEVVGGDAVAEFLARQRIRYTAGLDPGDAASARDYLGVESVLVGTLDAYGVNQGVPVFAASLRLVSAEAEARILWMDGVAMAGDDAPGAFGLGLVYSMQELEAQALSRLADSLAAFLGGSGPPVPTCASSSRFRPSVRFRREPPLEGDRVSVAVLPFVNRTRYRWAGETVSTGFTRSLAARPRLQVLEPGIIRQALLRHRVVMEDGVSLDAARIALGALDADVVVSGYVRAFEGHPLPRLEFTVIAIETHSNRVVWQSTSFNRGTDGVWFFDAGRVGTGQALACQMVESVVEEMGRLWTDGVPIQATPKQR